MTVKDHSTSEKKSLLKSDRLDGYGSTKPRSGSKAKDPNEKRAKIPFLKLFRFATNFDVFLMTAGTVFAIIHGAGWPILALIFGEMTNTFLGAIVTDPATQEFPTDGKIVSDDDNNNTFDSAAFEAAMSQYAIYYALIGVFVFIASTLQIACWQYSCERQVYHLRQEFFYQVMRQEIGWFDKHENGGLASKLNDDIERMREGLGDKLSIVIQSLATFIAGYAVGFAKGWELTVVILCLSPLLAFCTGYVGKIAAQSTIREQKRYAVASAVTEEVLSNIRTVATLCGQWMEIKKYNRILDDAKTIAKGKYIRMGLGLGFNFMIIYLSYGIAYWFGTQLVIKARLDPGAVFAILFAVMMGSSAIGNAIPHITTVATAQGAAALVFEVLEKKVTIDPFSKDGTVLDVQGNVELSNINFSYPTRRTVRVLTDFNLSIKKGQTVALCGSSGCGKSTVVNLLLRFYDPNQGSVKIDGINLKHWNLRYMRSQIGVVSQEPVLFSCSILENIRLGNYDATDKEIIEAAKKANAHEFIRRLPDGYATEVGERGAQLSGGQKQRIAIARALVRDPKILVLDEATSALDAESEFMVQEALDKASRGRTTIIIAHRLSTIKNADVICALHQGVVVERGTHQDLMELHGLYYNLVTAQTFTDEKGAVSDTNTATRRVSFADTAVIRRKSVADRRRHSSSVLRPLSSKSRGKNLDGEDVELGDVEPVVMPSFFKVLSYNKANWKLIVGGVIASALTGITVPCFAIFYGEIFQTYTLPTVEMEAVAMFWSLMFVALAITTFFTYLFMMVFMGYASENLLASIRGKAFKNVLRQDIAWFDDERHASGKITTRLATDVPMIKTIAGHRIGFITSSIFTLGAGLALAYIFGWQLALALTAAAPVLIIVSGAQLKLTKKNQLRNAKLMEDAGRVSSEAIDNIRTVQALNREEVFFQNYVDRLLMPFMANKRIAITYALAFAFSEGTIFFVYAGAFKFGSYLVSRGLITAINVYRVFFAVSLSAISVGQITSMLPDYAKAKLSAGLVFELIEAVPGIDSFSRKGVKPPLQGNIAFVDVSFRYPSRMFMKILKSMSFEVASGQTLALVGASGCGKSTVISLLLRFYDPEDGMITIDGFDIRTMNITHLRQNMATVAQEPVLFNCSIRDNIIYGLKRDISQDKVEKACKQANIHDFISKLRDGYETSVGERGTQLSGGQKQRIAIARALVRDPVILLLDEATSALDTESEKAVQEALDKARAGRTCIVIAHRLSTVINADKIAVIDEGRIVETGTHSELLLKKGYYYRLTKKQMIKS